VMQRDPTGRVVTQVDLPNPEAMRIDQILLSDFFGLGSTVDNQINRLYDRYYELLMVKTRDARQDQELAEIKERLQKQREFGETERERMMLETIDEYRVQKMQVREAGEKKSLEAETRRELKEIWSKVRDRSRE